MKKIILLIVLISIGTFVSPQNLVPNPGFEDYNFIFHPVCNNDSFPVCNYWYSPTSDSPDYFNAISCFQAYNGAPENNFGTQDPHSGSGYYGFDVYVHTPFTNDREYIQIKLQDSLKKDIKYCASFYVSLADSMWYAVNRIGIYFSDTAITRYDGNTMNNVLNYQPQVFNPDNNIISDKQNWTLISGSFIAKGGENYITIGNFFDDNNTSKNYIGGSYWDKYDGSYYYIDDVSVIECPPDTIDSTGTTEVVFNVFPSPAQNDFYIKYENLNISTSSFELMDICGRKIKEIKINKTTGTQAISTVGIASGVYLYRLLNNSGVLYSGKIIVAK